MATKRVRDRQQQTIRLEDSVMKILANHAASTGKSVNWLIGQFVQTAQMAMNGHPPEIPLLRDRLSALAAIQQKAASAQHDLAILRKREREIAAKTSRPRLAELPQKGGK